MVGTKDILKTISVITMAACAVFVSTLFLNYFIDLSKIEGLITTTEMRMFYDAQLMTSKVVVSITGASLLLTIIITLFFYIKIYIDNHRGELGILKALGYPDITISKRFGVFGI